MDALALCWTKAIHPRSELALIGDLVATKQLSRSVLIITAIL
jgi:hypothetical protein